MKINTSIILISKLDHLMKECTKLWEIGSLKIDYVGETI